MTLSLRFDRVVVARDGATVVAVDQVVVDAARGCVVSGPSGSGKTTLLRALAGRLDRAANVSGHLVLREAARETRWDARGMPPPSVRTAMIPQDASAALDPLHSAARFLAGVADDHGRSPDDVRRAVAAVGFPESRLFASTAHLSGGEARRALLAALVVADPTVWMLDEPTAGLDDAGCARVVDVLDAARASGRIVVVATHDARFAERTGAARFTIADGVLVAESRSTPAASSPPPPASGTPVVAWRGFSFAIGAARRIDVDDAVLVAGSVVGLVGPSGAGKSSFCAALSGETPAASGSVELDGALFAGRDRRPVGSARRRIGWVRQDALAALDPRRTARYLVSEAAESPGAVSEALGLAELPESLLARTPGALSGGERQRVQLARILASGPRVLLLDEVFAGIDPDRRARMLRGLRAWAAVGDRAVLLVTHDHGFLDAEAIPRFVTAGDRILATEPAC